MRLIMKKGQFCIKVVKCGGGLLQMSDSYLEAFSYLTESINKQNLADGQTMAPKKSQVLGLGVGAKPKT